MSDQTPNFLMYEISPGQSRILVRVENESVWLTQAQMAELFQTSIPNVNIHIKNLFEEGELDEESTIKDYLMVRQEGGREVQRTIAHYNLDVIISVGYRVKSHTGTQFRIWATQRLREYMIKGFALDEHRLKEQATVGDYFDELLEKIRDIRSSEKVLYKRVRDICALSVDYRQNEEASMLFFAKVQNKFLWAVTENTAAEIVKSRANASKPNMGLTSFSGEVVRKSDIKISKNYLKADEIEKLNLLVSQFLDFAELQAKMQKGVTMIEWLYRLDDIVRLNGMKVLDGAGKVTANAAENFASIEFIKFDTRRKEAKKREIDTEPDVVDLESEIKSITAKRPKNPKK